MASQKQLLAAQETEIKKIKDDISAREADLKNQCDQRIQKLNAQHKQQVENLNSRLADMAKKKQPEKPAVREPEKPQSKAQPERRSKRRR